VILKGKVHKFGDNISTDLIAPGRFFHLRENLAELAKHTLEDVDPEFVKKVKAGDFIAAGKNFGMGSSREHAAAIIKLCGVGAVLANSFARIFFRNAVNIGLPVLECETEKIGQGDELEIDLIKGTVRNRKKGWEINFRPLPQVMVNILSDGGLLEHIRRHGGFKF